MDANREAETGQIRLRPGSDCSITTISAQQTVRRVGALVQPPWLFSHARPQLFLRGGPLVPRES
jgi:hypothetical protein